MDRMASGSACAEWEADLLDLLALDGDGGCEDTTSRTSVLSVAGSEPVQASLARSSGAGLSSEKSSCAGSPLSGPQTNSVDVDKQDVDSPLPEAPVDEVTATGKWQLGRNCGEYLNAQKSTSMRSQVLIVNVVSNLSLLPRKQLQEVEKTVTPGETQNRYSCQIRVAAALLGLAAATVASVYRDVEANHWEPVHKESTSELSEARRRERLQNEAGAVSSDLRASDASAAMRNLTSLALACAGEGRSGLEFEREVVRYQLSGATMGESLHSRHFFRETVFVADRILSVMDSFSWDRVLPGPGIASDFSLLLDPVALGHSAVPKNDEVLMLALNMVSSETCGLYTPMQLAIFSVEKL